jgi:predicted exporter
MLGRRSVLVLIATALAMAIYSGLHLRVGTDITNFLPVGSRSELAALSSRLADSPLTRTMVLSIAADESAVAIAAAHELAERLRAHPEVAWVRSEVGATDLEAVYRLYFPHRLALLSDHPERELPVRLSDAELRARALELRHRLASPASSFFEPLVAADPLGAFEARVRSWQDRETTLRMVDGQLVTPDGRFAILLLGTRSSAFDSGSQGRLLADLETAFDSIAVRRGADLRLERSAVGAFAVAAERSIKRELVWIVSGSAIGVTLLFLAFVASAHGLAIVVLPPLSGILVAVTSSLLVFGRLDGLTMAFGTSLMGIAIDYSNHLLLHHGLARPPESPLRTAARLRGSLVLGALTTVASFVGLLLTPFPAFRQMAFFAITGVLTSLAASLWILPTLLARAPPLPARTRVAAARLDHTYRRLERLPRRWLFAGLALCAASAVALPAVEWSDDLSRLTRFDPALVDEDRRVRERVEQLDGSRFVIALAPDHDTAVARNDQIFARLEAVTATGALDSTRSLHALLWSPELQRRNLDTLAALPDLAQRLDAAFRAEGFRPGAFAAFADALADPPPAPLRLEELMASPLRDLFAPFVFELGDRIAVVTYLRGLHDPGAVRAALADLDDVHLLDQRSFVDDIYREFRETSLRQILFGSGLVLLLLALRYRAWRPVLAAFVPSALVALVVLAVLAGLREPANLLHVMSLVMVMGMGVDYGIFCVDSAGRGEEFGATLLSLLLSCLTTALVFGTLSLSSQPSLRAIGLTTGVGILLSFALAPLSVVALRVRPVDRNARG